MPQDLQRARELFLHAVGQMPPEQWDGYLAEACGSDDELRRQVAHLLQVHREAGSFLERPAEGLAATGASAGGPAGEPAALQPEAAGTAIGPYKLLELIGEGGMGTRLDGPADRAGQTPGRHQAHQGGHGLEAGHRPLRGRARRRWP